MITQLTNEQIADLEHMIAVSQAYFQTSRTDSMRAYWEGRQKGAEEAIRTVFGAVLSLDRVDAICAEKVERITAGDSVQLYR